MATNLWNTGNTTTNEPDDARVFAYGDSALSKTFNFTWASLKNWIRNHFVDKTTAQTVAEVKTFSSQILVNTGGGAKTVYNSGNSNLSTVDWAAKDIVATGSVTANSSVSPRIKLIGNSATGFPGVEMSNTTQAYEMIVRGNESNKLQIRDATGAIDMLSFSSGTGDATFAGSVTATSYKTGALTGTSGSFTSNDGKTITVTNGIITNIV